MFSIAILNEICLVVGKIGLFNSFTYEKLFIIIIVLLSLNAVASLQKHYILLIIYMAVLIFTQHAP